MNHCGQCKKKGFWGTTPIFCCGMVRCTACDHVHMVGVHEAFVDGYFYSGKI